jgi:hypothetical protein
MRMSQAAHFELPRLCIQHRHVVRDYHCRRHSRNCCWYVPDLSLSHPLHFFVYVFLCLFCVLLCDGRVSIGPHNTSYRSLRNHLKLASLEPLLSAEEPSANPVTPAARSAAVRSNSISSIGSGSAGGVGGVSGGCHSPGGGGGGSGSNGGGASGLGLGGIGRSRSGSGGFGTVSPNCWASLCDVTACLEAPPTNSSPSGYAMDAAQDADPLPPPLPSTARLLPYEDFKCVSVPCKTEYLAFEVIYCSFFFKSSWFLKWYNCCAFFSVVLSYSHTWGVFGLLESTKGQPGTR